MDTKNCLNNAEDTTIVYMFLGGYPTKDNQPHVYKRWITFLNKQNYPILLISHPIKHEELGIYGNEHKLADQIKGEVKNYRVDTTVSNLWTPTKWGTAQIVKATLYMLYEARQRLKSKGKKGYFMLVDKTTYPLYTENIKERLYERINKNMIMDGSQWVGLTCDYVERLFCVIDIDVKYKENFAVDVEGINIVATHNWCDLCGELKSVREILINTFQENNNRLCPPGVLDECFFQTMFEKLYCNVVNKYEYLYRPTISETKRHFETNNKIDGSVVILRTNTYIYDDKPRYGMRGGKDKKKVKEVVIELVKDHLINNGQGEIAKKIKSNVTLPELFQLSSVEEWETFEEKIITHLIHNGQGEMIEGQDGIHKFENIITLSELFQLSRVTDWQTFEEDIINYLRETWGRSHIFTDWSHTQPTASNLFRGASKDQKEIKESKTELRELVNELKEKCDKKREVTKREVGYIVKNIYDKIGEIIKPYYWHPLEYVENDSEIPNCIFPADSKDCVTKLVELHNLLTVCFNILDEHVGGDNHVIMGTILSVMQVFENLKGLVLNENVTEIAKGHDFLFIRKVINVEEDMEGREGIGREIQR